MWGIHSFHWKQHYIRILVQKFTIFLRKYYFEVSCNLNALYHGMSFTIYHSAHRYILSFPAHNECKSLSCDQKHLTNIWTILTLLSKGHTICFQRKNALTETKTKKVSQICHKMEDFKFKLSTTVVFKYTKQLLKIRQHSSYMYFTKTSSKANMANFNILTVNPYQSSLCFYISLTSNSTNACRSFGIIVTQLK